jgi:NADH-quinone oxidoreductase subunit L
VAYTTSSHLGLVLIGVGLGAPSAATFHLLTHGFMKAHAILALGVVTSTFRGAQRGETDLRKMGGLGPRMRWTAGFVAIAFLGLAGVPPLAGFFSIEEMLAFLSISDRSDRGGLLGIVLASLGILAFAFARVFCLVFWGNVRPGGRDDRSLLDAVGWPLRSLFALSLMTISAGLLTPSQFWGEIWGVGVSEMDSVGFFLARSLSGTPDPGLSGGGRWRLIGALILVVSAGAGLGLLRHATRGYTGEPKQPLVLGARNAMREMFFVEAFYERVLVRPLRVVSRWGLAVGIEQRLLDRVIVSGGSSLVRQSVWNVLRKIQNGRLQSYALLGLLSMLVALVFMLGWSSS